MHKSTHPARIAQQFGVTERYVRRVWNETTVWEMPTAGDALQALEGAK